MIEDLLPPQVAVVDTTADLAGELFPAEAAVLARAVEKRRREFTTVRVCARRAMAALGVEPHPLLPGERGAPTWPAGLVGTMTHCDGYRAAAVARAGQLPGLGIDGEPHDRLPPGVLGVVASASERAALAGLARRDPAVHWDRVLFSAKESVYKAWFPRRRTWLGFEDVELTIDPGRGTFSARRLREGQDDAGQAGDQDDAGLEGLRGRWAVRDGLVLTTAVWPPPPR